MVGALTVIDKDEIMLLTQQGQMVRTPVKDIREAGRNTQGVKLINLTAGDKLTAIARVISEVGRRRSGGRSWADGVIPIMYRRSGSRMAAWPQHEDSSHTG